LTATFGKLERAELRLESGLNVLELPNEGGKSTWSAFLLAMFYGIDTSERAAKGALPVKTKYKPWSGAAMEGRVELEWNGREITIERRSKGRIPLGEFRAYETESGLPVCELTAENCGLRLLGVEKAVFERSAFLRQTALAVSQDGALERRLSALVSTGEETVSYSETERRLRDWKNACRHNQTGELPKLERQLAELEGAQRQIHELQAGEVALQARKEELDAEKRRLSYIQRCLQAAEAQKRRRQLQEAEVQSRHLRETADEAKRAAAGLPDEAELRRWQNEWNILQAERRAVPATPLREPEPPVLPPVFAGKSAQEIQEDAEQAAWSYDAYEKAAQPLRHPFPWAAVAAALAAVALFFLPAWYFGVALLAVAAMLLAVNFRSAAQGRREAAAAAERAMEILRQYGARQRDDIPQMAEKARTALTMYEQDCRHVQEERAHREALAEAAEKKLSDCRGKLAAALPELDRAPDAALDDAIARVRAAEQAEQEAAIAERYYANLMAATQTVKEPDGPVEDFSGKYDAEEIARRKRQTEEALRETVSRLDRSQGRISALGDPAELESRKEQLREQWETQSQRYAALTLALETLEAANHSLQTRFAPEISRQAAEIMGRLTGGRYDKVLLDQSLSIAARETGEVVARELNRLSCGTADQLYFAVRLAISHAVLPEGTPLILDDAFVNFDDLRLKQALLLLQEEAKERQILLFTCQNREKTCLFSGEK